MIEYLLLHKPLTAVAVITIWNIAVFAMYGLDKSYAKRGGRRISERTLLLSAAFMGATGALFGMYIFRHKTKHMRFKLGVPLLLILNGAIVFVVYNVVKSWNIW